MTYSPSSDDMKKTTVKIKLRPSWTEDYLESLVDKAVNMQIFIRDKERGTIGLDSRFHELMGEQLDWALEAGYNDLKAEHVGSCISKYIIGDSRVNPTRSNLGNAVQEFEKMIKDKTFQDMCRMIRDFIVNATTEE